MMCAICEKKQSRFIEDFPLSTYDFETRICPECYEHLKILTATTEQEEIDTQKKYFTALMQSNSTTDTASEYLNHIITLSARVTSDTSIEALLSQNQIKEAAEANEKFEQLKRELIATTGSTVDGYRIVKYVDPVFDSKLVGIGIKTNLKGIGDIFASWTGNEFYALSSRISELKLQAIESLKSKAISKGANALIGISFETTLPGNSGIMVCVNATAVIIQKI